MSKSYPVGIVGEQHYRAEVDWCRPGQRAGLFLESGNRFDPNAIVVKNARGGTIGYIPKDSFLYEHVNESGGGAEAVIKSTDMGGGGFRQIVIDVSLNDDGLDVAGVAPAASPAAVVDDEPEGGGDVAPWKVAVAIIVILIIIVRCSTS